MALTRGVLLSFLGLCLCSVSALASDEKSPQWGLELKVGQLQPALDQWDTYYANDPVVLGVAAAYKLTRMFSVGLAVNSSTSNGQGDLPLNQTIGGDVAFSLRPVNLSLNLRLIRNEHQHWVPYLGAGLSRVYYRQEVPRQANVEGSVDGYHYKFGLQYLLDDWDRRSADNAKRKMGLDNTYVFVEFMSMSAEQGQGSLDLGGQLISLGVLLEM